jgi:hypothetical protein
VKHVDLAEVVEAAREDQRGQVVDAGLGHVAAEAGDLVA